MGLRELGAGCPTGPALPPGRWLGLGGTCTSTLAPHLQHLLSIRWQPNRGRGHFTGGLLASVPDSGKLPLSPRRLCNLDDQRDQKSADRPLSPYQTRSADRFSRRSYARGGEQRIYGSAPRPAGPDERVERPDSKRADQALAGVTRSGHFARPPAIGICGDSARAGSARRHCEISNQSWTYRVSQDLATNGSKTVMRTGEIIKNLVILRERMSFPVGVEL